MFPDTYDIYVGSSAEVVIEKLLKRFSEVFSDDYMVRAEELGLTMDEVINLASLIEKEARTPDFARDIASATSAATAFASTSDSDSIST